MFRVLARQVQAGGLGAQAAAENVLSRHPMQLSRYLEQVWIARARALLPPRGLEVPIPLRNQEAAGGIAANVPPRVTSWDHLIYAYMIENTRVFEIFARVLKQFVDGEQLGVPDPAVERWARTTEALFFRDSPPFQIYALTSALRPDARAARRQSYYRLFGMDLNHGTDGGRPYPYDKPRAANREFVVTFEELLREVWRGVENRRNTSGADPTDVATIEDLVRALDEMLSTRRLNGNLNREELWYTSMMSWFHLTLSFDTPVVRLLSAEGAAPEERLMKIGVRVGLPAHSRSHSYFRIADPISQILRFVEAGRFNTATRAAALYTQPTFRDAMTEIISQWSLATGRDMKARKVAVSASTTPGQPPPPQRPQRPLVSRRPPDGRARGPAPSTDGARTGAPTV
jgi:hypothetical protein